MQHYEYHKSTQQVRKMIDCVLYFYDDQRTHQSMECSDDVGFLWKYQLCDSCDRSTIIIIIQIHNYNNTQVYVRTWLRMNVRTYNIIVCQCRYVHACMEIMDHVQCT